MTTVIESDKLTDSRRTAGTAPSRYSGGPAPAGGQLTSSPGTAPSVPTGGSVLGLLWRRGVLFVVGMAVIFGVIELTLFLTEEDPAAQRAFNRRQPMPYVEFYSEPDYHGRGQDQERIDTNEAGFRYGPLPMAKPAGEIRVFFLGGSFGFRGRTNDTTIAGFMERQLADRSTPSAQRVRVINASGTSFCLRQSLALLVTRVLDYEPDVIVVFHGPEVLYYPTVYESRPGYPFNFIVRELLQDRVAGKLEGPNPLVSLLKRTRVMRRFHPDLDRKSRQAEVSRYNHVITIDSVEQYDPYVEVVGRDIERISRLAAAYGCRTLVALPPWRSPTLLPGAVDRLTEEVRASCPATGDGGARFVDTRPLVGELTTRGLWRPDGIHWDDEGNRLIAERLVKGLIDHGFLD